VTALLTLNTDFLEAPVDDFRTELTRFPPFFPERRDFFLQDAGIFEFGGLTDDALPFFSRRIGRLDNEMLDIDGGLKLTGRIGDTSFGALSVRVPKQRLHPRSQEPEPPEIDPTYLNVARVQHNVLGESAIGLIGTYGDPRDEIRNGLVGADFQYFNSHVRGDHIVSGNVFFMRSFSSEGGSTEEAFGAVLAYPNDRYYGDIGFRQIGDDFNPALGFAIRRGIRRYDAMARYRVRPASTLRSITSGVDTRVVTDLHDDLATLIVTVDAVEFESNAGDKLKFSYIYNDERLLRGDFNVDPKARIPEGSYRFDRYGVRLETSNARPLRAIAEVIWGTFYDGRLRQANTRLELRPSRRLFLSLEDERNDGVSVGCKPIEDEDKDEGCKRNWPDGDFTQRLGRVRLNLAFTPEISWTNVLQYENDSDRIGLNSIFRWEIESGNELFLVFNQNWDEGEKSSDFDSAHTVLGAKVVWTFRF
jgi:hypothetical protein